MVMIRSALGVVALTMSMALPAAAAQVFYDDFSSDTPGLQVSGLTNFSVTGGVDVVAPANPYGITTPGGNVVDLDGSSGPGEIVSNQSFAFSAGDVVTLTVDLGGAQRGSVSDSFYFGFGFFGMTTVSDLELTGFASASDPGPYSLNGYLTANGEVPGDMAFGLTSFSFTALTDGDVEILLGTFSGDNIGPLVASVALDISPAAVPLPAGGVMLLSALAGVAGLRRRKRSA